MKGITIVVQSYYVWWGSAKGGFEKVTKRRDGWIRGDSPGITSKSWSILYASLKGIEMNLSCKIVALYLQEKRLLFEHLGEALRSVGIYRNGPYLEKFWHIGWFTIFKKLRDDFIILLYLFIYHIISNYYILLLLCILYVLSSALFEQNIRAYFNFGFLFVCGMVLL